MRARATCCCRITSTARTVAPMAYEFDFTSPSSSFSSEPQKPRKRDPLEEFLRVASAAAPAIGTAAGGLIGGFAGGGAASIPGGLLGASIGGGIGSAIGGLGTGAADAMAAPAQDDETARLNRERERQAREMAALQLLGSM